MSILYPKPILCNVLKELCAIRDNITTCDIASITDIIAMIEDICVASLQKGPHVAIYQSRENRS